ncbi:ABC-F family ATP-binding cassette domain-containing protein [Cryobacterium sp. AP23]
MATAHASTILLTDVGLTWPDGSTAFTGISAAFGRGRTGLVGANGSGKSTLLRLITGQLRPTTGTVTVSADVGYLPQTLTLDVGATAADLLGVRSKLDALRAIESGDVDERHFEVLGDDWDLPTRSGEALRSAGLAEADLDRPVGAMSGGEAILVAIAGLRLTGAPIAVLDEPTNNLDRAARHRLSAMVRSWPGALVVVSHDSALLELMDDTAELHGGALAVFGGPYSAFLEHRDREQNAAVQAQRSADQSLRKEKQQRIEAETKLARRGRFARTEFENKSVPKIVMGLRKSAAQVSAGKLRTEFDGKVQDARAAAAAASARVRTDDSIHVDLPDPNVPAGKRLAELHGVNRSVLLQGPMRVALTGPNGVGKTSLLESLVHPLTARAGLATATAFTSRIGYLGQRLDGLDEAASALENLRLAAPAVSPGELRSKLARFLLRGDAVGRPVRSLSGGERFRVSLARLLLADPPAQLLVLDEPTNNLDRQSLDQLVGALGSYRGGLLVVSHDDAFLGRLGLTDWLALDAGGQITEEDPSAGRA